MIIQFSFIKSNASISLLLLFWLYPQFSDLNYLVKTCNGKDGHKCLRFPLEIAYKERLPPYTCIPYELPSILGYLFLGYVFQRVFSTRGTCPRRSLPDPLLPLLAPSVYSVCFFSFSFHTVGSPSAVLLSFPIESITSRGNQHLYIYFSFHSNLFPASRSRIILQ